MVLAARIEVQLLMACLRLPGTLIVAETDVFVVHRIAM